MKITYGADGRILSCSVDEAEIEHERVLQVPEDQLPDDFLSTFALGKYHVEDGELVENPDFVPPETSPVPSSGLFSDQSSREPENDQSA
jgi:hypothetical protein